MLVYNITTAETINYKLDQLKSLGLSSLELNDLSDILSSSYSSMAQKNDEDNFH